MAETSLRYPWAKPCFGRKEKEYVADALESSWISGGPYVERLEKEFIRRNGAAYGLSTSNGTTALHLALWALGIGPGDEVIVPGFTFVAPGNMVLALGATPVFVDIDPKTWCLDPARIEAAVTPRTKAVIAVHVYGNVCDMDAILSVSRRLGLAVVEDAAEATFSRHKGRCAGSMGDLGCFSFHATKTMTTGEGGFVLAQKRELWEKMRVIRDHGMRPGKRYWHDVVGHNFRLTNLQAALGCGQLESLEDRLQARRKVYERYVRRLSGLPGIELQSFAPDVDAVVWAVALRLDPERFSGRRDALIAQLGEAGIETRPGFYPFSLLPPYRCAPLPISESVGANVLSLPSYPELGEADVDHICAEFQRLTK
ncbi:MAG TPA: DegT/DnrJ/EryC1/StrS family aminotransferase [Elusimicrobia bacterium]|nr:DegT/DnrJ/EryC1/StrS family aminotransferase [Elusimicrobiota bacterium]HBT60276.1 DegT/DnrJ/EryC1/StrS family aminotransferase [Elusimicrobiota bacterium]